ncbi:HNH/ENDO VII family nuclease [Alkaliphilus peptidifermentans]|uniref:A nuclease of the HNH/ENDO VII superfamily with conserved LHH n=1 Tax=Alkaliphilus peptidifermentans DSM 18978 TaxID=1120976 RepID=A0A1G5EAZ1_9FIRM|nr:HNH/ENDO VII family nuclease [Alkaliphilus peptidifermentans]SCY24065.1 A nuclease of the HNH/ENDO VII superfamily with conserved LHH [Alkaliphilus peptidifermentans DSM 18978]
MNAFMKFAEINWQDSSLVKLAKEMPNKTMDISELDKPLSFSCTNDSTEKKGLTDEDKQKIKEETGWSDEIIDAIESMEEYKIYKDAGLQEAEIDGKKCLIRNDIDLEQKDDFGQTNRERMANGLPPITKSGETVELHHIGQKSDSPLAELTTQEHRGKGNDKILHDKSKESEIDRNEFAKERSNHWEIRANESE